MEICKKKKKKNLSNQLFTKANILKCQNWAKKYMKIDFSKVIFMEESQVYVIYLITSRQSVCNIYIYLYKHTHTHTHTHTHIYIK